MLSDLNTSLAKHPLLIAAIFMILLSSCAFKTPEPISWTTAGDPQKFDAAKMQQGFKDYLSEKYNSKLANYTDVIVAACKEHDCDPCLIVAIGVAETTAGKTMTGDYNFWNYLPGGEGNPAHDFKSWENSIYALAWEFGESGSHKNKSTLEAINSQNPPFCASGCEHWMTNVRAVYKDLSSLGCDLNTDLTYPGD